MRLHALLHVPFEGLGHIGSWISRRGHQLTESRLYDSAVLPPMDAFDRLVIMGGPMNVDEEAAYPWLIEEKAFIREAVAAGKSAVGICLGAQLLASALGAPVYTGREKEIGWFPVRLTAAGRNTELCRDLPAEFTVFHWHGDTFDLPSGAIPLAESEACDHQAFLYDNRILGLQFHLESTPEMVQHLLAHCRNELVPGPFIQTMIQIGDVAPERFAPINTLLDTLLDRLP